jgi:acyl-CoA synthetase (AMP-forming)/AMP-acid ligase II
MIFFITSLVAVVANRLRDNTSSAPERYEPEAISPRGSARKALGEPATEAVVVLRPRQETGADDLGVFCQERLAGYNRPRSVDFVSELPRNASDKLLKRELREKYWQGRDRRVS